MEAKRRLAAGEFPALHDAQLAIAWEHGQPSWTALKQRISQAAAADCHVLPQLGWLIARFRTADGPGWTAPGAAEMQEHFAPELLAVRPVPELVAVIASAAPALREELTVLTHDPLTAQVRIGGLPGLAVAGGGPGTHPWVVTRGWADLDRDTSLQPGHCWPSYCGSALVTTGTAQMPDSRRAPSRSPSARPSRPCTGARSRA